MKTISIKEEKKVYIVMTKKLWKVNSTKKLKTRIETTQITKPLVQDAKVKAKVISLGESGAWRISTIFPWIFPIMILDEECEKACWIICIAIKPGAQKLKKGKPNTSPLSVPIASDKTIKKSKEVTMGESIVWTATIKNLRTSFL